MDLEEILSHHRQMYINQLIDFYENRGESVKELLMELNVDDEALLFNLYRLDYVVKVDDELIIEELSPETYIHHSPISFTFGELYLELNPFYWHGCEFTIDKKFQDFERLKSWAKTYMDEEDTFQPDSNGLTGTIHSISYPTTEQHRTKFTVDLGTASVNTFMTLLHCIQETGANNVVISSFDLLN